LQDRETVNTISFVALCNLYASDNVMVILSSQFSMSLLIFFACIRQTATLLHSLNIFNDCSTLNTGRPKLGY